MSIEAIPPLDMNKALGARRIHLSGDSTNTIENQAGSLGGTHPRCNKVSAVSVLGIKTAPRRILST